MADDEPQVPQPSNADSEEFDQRLVAVEKRIDLGETINKPVKPTNDNQ